QWVEQSWQWLEAVAMDPLVYRQWEDAKQPWQFLAWVLDWYALRNDPNHISHLPIHQDATQSGIQIYSLLARDLEGAISTNCVPSSKPEDLYGRVANRLTEMLVECPDQIAKDWLAFGIDRDCTKRATMTRVYNATRHSARTYVQDWAIRKGREEQKKIPALEGGSAIWWLTERLWEAMDAVTSIANTQNWLGQCARIFSDLGLAMSWTSPLGMPIRQWYPNWATKTVKTLVAGIYRQTGLRQAERTLNPRRMRSAFAPNFIHSLDAAAMFRTVTLASEAGVSSFACIHDSFATVAADSQKLADATREAYVGLFENDLLSALRDELQSQLPRGTALPPVPQFGSLDVSELRQSRYFFS
ncbi:MAG: DNA-directed RNA polymerase, partial [Rhodoglobus sp.]